MGGSVSSGRNNDELVDNLCDGSHIKSECVEKVFRAVDRAIYYLPSHRDVAYRDLAWREGNIHISAPCIYSEVMEALEIKYGNSFLNIGSGTGYISTMIGLMIGPYGVNHNIEIHSDVIDYSKARISEFLKTSIKFDHFDFCMPKFVNGNFLNLILNHDTRLYDRIYVGTGVTSDHYDFLKSLLNINGVMVMPLEDCLVQIKRKSENDYDKKTIMSVSFASLITQNIALNTLSLPKINPLKLQELCRFKIRQIIRQAIEHDFCDYYKLRKRIKRSERSNMTADTRGDDDAESHDSRYTRRIFFGRDTLTEAQLRLLIHGRLYGRSNLDDDDVDDDGDEEEEEQHENEERDENHNNNESAVAAANENSNQIEKSIDKIEINDQQQVNNDDNGVSQINNNECLSDKKSVTSTIPIPQVAKQVSNGDMANNSSVCESGFSESEQSSSLDMVVNHSMSAPNRTINALSSSSALLLKATSQSNDSITTDYDSVGSRDSCFFTDMLSASSSLNNACDETNKNQNASNLIDKTIVAASDVTIKTTEDDNVDASSTISTCGSHDEQPKTSDATAKPKQEPPQPPPSDQYVNHLRNRILQLEIPTSLKNYLLYYREI